MDLDEPIEGTEDLIIFFLYLLELQCFLVLAPFRSPSLFLHRLLLLVGLFSLGPFSVGTSFSGGLG